MDVDPHIRVAILAGGIGSRFWPASTPSRPKPLLPLVGDRPLIAQTIERARNVAAPDGTVVLAGAHLRRPILNAAPTLRPDQIWTEPRARGTGPVLAWAAHKMHRIDPEAVLVSLHADHTIEPPEAFTALIRRTVALARQEGLVMLVAVTPDRPETGFGYLRPGEAIVDEAGFEGFRVGEFVEKPDLSVAEAYLARGYLWNSGIFVLPVSRFLEEVRSHAPEIGRHLALLDRGEDDAFFDAVPGISVDEAVMERSAKVGAVRATFRWDDVGSWEALARTGPRDEDGNVTRGSVTAIDTTESVAWSDDGPLVLFGVSDLVAVRSGGITLVTTRERSADLKSLMARLSPELRAGKIESPSSPSQPTDPPVHPGRPDGGRDA